MYQMFEAKKFTDYDLRSVKKTLSETDDWDVTFGADKKSIVCRRGKYSANMFVIEYDKKINDYVFSGVNIPNTVIKEVIDCLMLGEN